MYNLNRSFLRYFIKRAQKERFC